MKALNFLTALSLLLLGGAYHAAPAQRATAAAPRRDPAGLRFRLAVRADEATPGPSVERAKAVIVKRCGLLRVNCKLEPTPGGGPNQLTLDVSGGLGPRRVREVLLAEGLVVLPVVSPPFPSPLLAYDSPEEARRAAREDETVLPYEEGGAVALLVVKRAPIITGDDARAPSAFVARGTRRSYDVHFGLSREGSERLAAWTGANINNYLAVVYNGRVVAAHYVKSAVSLNGEINGRFTRAAAADVVRVLSSGNLPAPVEVLEEGARRP
ncbi:MAG TPA: hypothetical protein VER08_05275 [Pyrinomonadaceae bacterium]|nr:hypothetical protein [Pyrinomonadaceae bacterium]